MARMVDADALAKAMGVYTYMQTEWTTATAWGVPIVDAEPVVRCKDCQFFHRYGFKLEYTECDHFDCDVTEDGYCCWAERREDDSK